MPELATPARKPKDHRRRPEPERTRAAILDAACTLLAKDGPEGLSVSQVARLAKVNRGTAYQHFQTREQLLEATTAWVSEKLRRSVFGGSSNGGPPVLLDDAQGVARRMAEFAMENPQLGRVWLFEVLNSKRPDSDPFLKQFMGSLKKFTGSAHAQPGIDVEVHAVIMMIGTLLWPIFVRADARTARERRELVERYSAEMLRLSFFGTMRPERFPELQAKLRVPREGARP